MAITNRTKITSWRLLATTLVLIASSAHQLQSVQWYPFDKATEKARDEQKLLMVVQGPDDVSLPIEKCAAAKSFRQAALSDARLTDFYDFRIVATYRATGLPQLAPEKRQRKRAELNKPSHANVVTYFCGHTSSGQLQVIHFVVGFPTSRWLQAQCDWAYAAFDSVKSHSREELPKALSEAHRQQLIKLGEPVPAFATLPSLHNTLKMAAKFRDTRLLTRFGVGWTPAERVKLIGSLRPHAELQVTTGHQVLALHPQIRLPTLEQPAFEILTRQEFWRPPTRRDYLTKWFHLQRERHRPLLVIVSPTDAASSGGDKKSFNNRVWQPKRHSIREILRAYDTIELSRTELICLMRDLDLTLPDRKTFNEITFLLFDRSANDPLRITEDDESKLQRLMERTLNG